MRVFILFAALSLGLMGISSSHAQQRSLTPPKVEIQLTADQIKAIKAGQKEIKLTQEQSTVLEQKAKAYLGKLLTYDIFSVEGPDVIAKVTKITMQLEDVVWKAPPFGCSFPAPR
jgi:hypothetical protein